MRVTLFYNHAAGRNDGPEALAAAITKAGHNIIQTVHVGHEPVPALAPGTDLVVAAGGDGTVAGVAKLVSGTTTPMTILPMGTANNIARSLGIAGTPDELAAGWERWRVVGFDVGILDFASGRHVFFESVGTGLVPAVIHSMDTHDSSASAAAMISQALDRYQEILSRLEPRPWRIAIDDSVTEDEFLLVEILNTTYVGPNLALARHVRPTDGHLSVVAIREHERDALQRHLARRHDPDQDIPFQVVHARTVELTGVDALHIDDTLHKVPPDGPMTFRVDEGAVQVLV